MYRKLQLLLRLLEGDTGANAGGAQSQAGGASGTSAQAATTTSSASQAGGGTTKTSEDYERIISDLRKENAGHRTKLNKFETDEQARLAANQTELERATTALTEREKQIQAYKDQLVAERVKSAAISKGIIDPELAALALKDSLEFDKDSGMPANLDKALDDLLKAKPYLAASAQGQLRQASSGGATNPGRATASGTAHIDMAFAQNVMAGKAGYEWHKLSPEEQNAVRVLLNPRLRR